MSRLIDLPFRQVSPLITALSKAGMGEELAELLRNEKLAWEAVRILESRFLDQSCLYQMFPLIHCYFRDPAIQIATVRGLCTERESWRFLQEDLDRLGSPPPWPDRKEHPFGAVVLVPYFESGYETYIQLSMVSGPRAGVTRYDFDHERSWRGVIDYWPGSEHARGLVWERIDLSPVEPMTSFCHKSAERWPSAGVLAAGLHFPHWIRATRNEGVVSAPQPLQVVLPGFCVVEEKQPERMPVFNSWKDMVRVDGEGPFIRERYFNIGLVSPELIQKEHTIARFIAD